MRAALEDSGGFKAIRTDHYTDVLSAPMGGWSSDSSIAKENPGAAEVLENWLPTTRGVKARGGSTTHATVGSIAVSSLMIYQGTISQRMFAACGGNIYDVSTPASPNVIPPAAVSGMGSDNWSYVNVSNPSANYMLAFNGVNLHRVYDGATWAANTPAITGISSADVIQASVHNNRVWLTKKDSKEAYYLPVDSVGGAALSFYPYNGGGKHIFSATWSQDSGEGSADRWVGVSSLGEVAVFTGDNPGSASTWRLFGRYRIAPPLGSNSFQKVGGDLLIMTINGIVSMSEVVTKDPAALNATAITRFIEPDWKKATSVYGTTGWSFLKWDNQNLGIVSVPTNLAISAPQCFAVNLQTGRWSKITGWDCRSMAVFGGEFYFGSGAGKVVKGNAGGSDQGIPYVCRLAYWPSRFKAIGDKQFLQASAVFEYSTSFVPKINIAVNNVLRWTNIPPYPPNDNTNSTWDFGLWDVAVFDGGGERQARSSRWISLGRRGRVGAIMIQLSFNNTTTPDVEFLEAIVTYEKAAVVA